MSHAPLHLFQCVQSLVRDQRVIDAALIDLTRPPLELFQEGAIGLLIRLLHAI
jgi:hypothetical protein